MIQINLSTPTPRTTSVTLGTRPLPTLCDARVAATNKPCYAHALYYDAVDRHNYCGRHRTRTAKPGTGPSWSQEFPPISAESVACTSPTHDGLRCMGCAIEAELAVTA